MRRQIRAFWITGSIIVASTPSPLHPAFASPRLISLAFNSQLQAPQQFGADVFREKLMALDSKRFVVDVDDFDRHRLIRPGRCALIRVKDEIAQLDRKIEIAKLNNK